MTSIYRGGIQPKGFSGLPSDWSSEWETFASSDGRLKLFEVHHYKTSLLDARSGTASDPIVRVLLVLHGLGEHGGRYLHFPQGLSSSVDWVTCLDHRGHGRSEGVRGHIDSFDQYVEDAALAFSRLEEKITRRFARAEFYLFGHSMGGLIALRVLLMHPELRLRAAAVSAPLLGVQVAIPPVKAWVARGLSAVWSSLQMTSVVNADHLSHDPEVARAYREDQLVHSKVTPRFFTEMTGAIADTLSRRSGIYVPLQFLVPLQDQIVDPDATLKYYHALECREKSIETYPGYYHEPFNEGKPRGSALDEVISKERVFVDLGKWITRHSQRKGRE